MRDDGLKGLTRRQADIQTLEQAWLYYLPHSTPPLLRHICHWLKRASISQILELVERAASEGVEVPSRWVFAELKRLNPQCAPSGKCCARSSEDGYPVTGDEKAFRRSAIPSGPQLRNFEHFSLKKF